MTLATITVSVVFASLCSSAAGLSTVYWRTSSQCTQTGQLGDQSFTCENAAVPGYLATHTVSDRNGHAVFELPRGAYCSYYGLNQEHFEPVETDIFPTPEPFESYQEGNEWNDTCAAWAATGEPLEWGLEVNGGESEEHGKECALSDRPSERCGMMRYLSLGNGLADRPWGSDFVHPVLELSPREKVEFEPEKQWEFDEGVETPGKGWGWGPLCPVLENVVTKDIVEACFEKWRSFADGPEWHTRHVAECGTGAGPEGTDVDKVVLGDVETEELATREGTPLEKGGDSKVEALSAYEMQQVAELDDAAYEAKEEDSRDPGERRDEPEIGFGCGRTSPTQAQDWALIGVSDGIEMWQALSTRATLHETSVRSTFEPHPVEGTSFSASAGEASVTLTGEIDPYGFPTKYVVELYGGGGEAAEATLGQSTEFEHVAITLKKLEPGTRYNYVVKAYHYELPEEEGTYWAEGSFTTEGAGEQCSGGAISGQGSTLQRLAQLTWDSAFNTSTDAYACSGTQGSHGKPAVKYLASGSGTGLKSWHVESSSGTFGASNAFIATDEPPNALQIAELESQETPRTTETVLSVPVAESALAIIVHLPSGCTANDARAEERLVFSNATLQGVFSGKIKLWGEINDDEDTLTPASCDDEPIKVVVREDQSGTTHILKRYLNLIEEDALEAESGAKDTWGTLSEGSLNTAWPKEAAVIRPAESGAAALIGEVAATPGSIGYAALGDVEEDGRFSDADKGGGPGKERFWVELERGKHEYADPSKAGDVESDAAGNCTGTYTDGQNPFPPPYLSEPWSEVSTKTTGSHYTLCGLTYIVAFLRYHLLPGTTVGEATTVHDIIRYILDKSGGQELLEADGYSKLSGSVQKLARDGVAGIGY